jgi:putative NADH-flavin reductase
MNLAVFGATGGTGRQFLRQALDQGHAVQALARSPSKLERITRLTVIAGDVLDQSAVDRCLDGVDAVICSLGSHGNREPIEARGTARIIDGMERLGVRRLIAVTSMGVGDSRDQVPGFFRLVMRLTLRRIMAAKEEQESLIRNSGLDWTIVRPGGLTDGSATGSYLSGIDRSIKATRISRADVAAFMLKELSDNRYLHQAPAISHG